MKPIEVLQSVTYINASVFEMDHLIGKIQADLLADLIVVTGAPSKDISRLRNIEMVMKGGGEIVKE